MRKPVDGVAASIMLVLCFAWGLQQIAIKAIAADVSPVMQIALRSGVAAVLVWIYGRMIMRGVWLPGLALRSGAVVGVLFALEFLLVGEALRWTSASHVAVFLYTAPLFAAVGLHLWLPAERLSAMQWMGIGIAFAGIAIAFLGPGGPAHESGTGSSSSLLGDMLALAGGAAWGATTVVIRTTRLSEAPAPQTLFYQLVTTFLLLFPFALLTGQSQFQSTPLVWASLGFQTLVVAFVSFLVWFWLLRNYLAARLGVLSFMTPIFGVALGVLLLDEQLAMRFVVGSAMVLIGMLIVNAQVLVGRRGSQAPKISAKT